MLNGSTESSVMLKRARTKRQDGCLEWSRRWISPCVAWSVLPLDAVWLRLMFHVKPTRCHTMKAHRKQSQAAARACAAIQVSARFLASMRATIAKYKIVLVRQPGNPGRMRVVFVWNDRKELRCS